MAKVVHPICSKLERVLKIRKIKLESAVLSTFATYEVTKRKILLVGRKSEQPLVIVHRNIVAGLVGNVALRELPMTISCARMAGKSLRPILNCGAFDAIGMTYGLDEFAVIIDASFLAERLQRG